MRVEIFYPPEGTFCVFEPAFNVPYRQVHSVETPVQTLPEALDWMWRYTNIVQPADPWVKTGLRSAMVGDVFVVNNQAHAVMMLGFERFEFHREGDRLILHRLQTNSPIFLLNDRFARSEDSNAVRKKKRGKGQG